MTMSKLSQSGCTTLCADLRTGALLNFSFHELPICAAMYNDVPHWLLMLLQINYFELSWNVEV